MCLHSHSLVRQKFSNPVQASMQPTLLVLVFWFRFCRITYSGCGRLPPCCSLCLCFGILVNGKQCKILVVVSWPTEKPWSTVLFRTHAYQRSSGFLPSVCVRWQSGPLTLATKSIPWFQNFKRWGSLMFQTYSFIAVFKSNFQSGFYGSYHSSGQQQRGIWFEILGLCLNDITIQTLHKLYWQYMTVVNQNLSNAVEL